MNKYPPRRFICNFVDGTAEFNENDTPPAEEYLSLYEYNNLKDERDILYFTALEVYNLLSLRSDGTSRILCEKLDKALKYNDIKT